MDTDIDVAAPAEAPPCDVHGDALSIIAAEPRKQGEAATAEAEAEAVAPVRGAARAGRQMLCGKRLAARRGPLGRQRRARAGRSRRTGTSEH
eukprot:361013-Chlamydomonas_euryale.AAC.4